MRAAKSLLIGVLVCSLSGAIGCAAQPQKTEQPKQEQGQSKQEPKTEKGKITFSDPRLQRISEKVKTKYTETELPKDKVTKVDLMNMVMEFQNGTQYKPDEYGLYSMTAYQVDKEKELYDWQKDDLVAMFIVDGLIGQPPYALKQIEEAKKRTQDKDLLEVLAEIEKGLREMPQDVVIGRRLQENEEKYPSIKKYNELRIALQKEFYEKIKATK